MSSYSEKLKIKYLEWVKSHTLFSDISENVARIDLPFKDSFLDDMVMYAVKESDNSLLLSDDGWTLDNLNSLGVSIDKRNKKRYELLENQLSAFGVSRDEKELYIKSSESTFPEDKHKLLQAMLFVSDMFMTSKSTSKSIFLDDVDDFLTRHEIRFALNRVIIGDSGLTHNFEFAIAGNKKIKDKLIKTMSSPNQSVFAKSIVTDVSQVKNKVSRPTNFYVFLQDKDIKVSSEIIELFKSNDIIPVKFNDRDKYVTELAE